MKTSNRTRHRGVREDGAISAELTFDSLLDDLLSRQYTLKATAVFDRMIDRHQRNLAFPMRAAIEIQTDTAGIFRLAGEPWQIDTL